MANFTHFEQKMMAAGMGDAAIRAFRRNYEALVRQESGMIPEASISPAQGLPTLEGIAPRTQPDPALLAQTVVIKLNGGLGTGMGLQGPKSLLAVRDGLNFLDLMARQILDLRETSGTSVRLLLMNSFSTSKDTLAHLHRYRDHSLADPADVELMQNQIPKIDEATMGPVSWPGEPDLEWCPPGHGDIYTALIGSGWLDRLLDAGVNYAFVSNSDNLGASLDPIILRHFADSGAPFLMEVTRRTASDRKGGHLARRQTDERLLLREVAQCPPSDMEAFQDIERHPYFNTNNLWLRLDRLKAQMVADAGVLPLPMIRNHKTVDPRNKHSTPVIQLESAMGAAIECFHGSTAMEVPRSRFAPVKTTGDLLALRSDAYEVLSNGQVRLHASRHGQPPVVLLGDAYKLVDSLDALGVPSLIDCDSLSLDGPLRFAAGVVIQGKVEISNSGADIQKIPAGTYRNEHLNF